MGAGVRSCPFLTPSNTAILLKEVLAHQLHQLLVGDVVDQAKTCPEAPLVLLRCDFVRHSNE